MYKVNSKKDLAEIRKVALERLHKYGATHVVYALTYGKDTVEYAAEPSEMVFFFGGHAEFDNWVDMKMEQYSSFGINDLVIHAVHEM